VGTWSVALYGSDIARDLRDDLQRIVRAPWDGDDIFTWVTARYPSPVDAK
jgi:cytochrome c-type biogenesis protein CcmH/NrfF